MTVKELVELAYEKDPAFAKKVDWYRNRTSPRKVMDLDWLMPQLEDILGRDFCLDAAEAEIANEEALNGRTPDKV
jgi:hypothetical protein